MDGGDGESCGIVCRRFQAKFLEDAFRGLVSIQILANSRVLNQVPSSFKKKEKVPSFSLCHGTDMANNSCGVASLWWTD